MNKEYVLKINKEKQEYKEKVFIYLDILRDTGVTNMFGAVEYLEVAFGFEHKEAKAYLIEWMETFSSRHNPKHK